MSETKGKPIMGSDRQLKAQIFSKYIISGMEPRDVAIRKWQGNEFLSNFLSSDTLANPGTPFPDYKKINAYANVINSDESISERPLNKFLWEAVKRGDLK